jgi:penicillin amidase
MPGTGSSDVIGVVPFAAVPQVYDPPTHTIVTANQRPVSNSYPYYLGTSLYFDPGYRAGELNQFLSDHQAMTVTEFAGLQHDVTDDLASSLVPELVTALSGTSLTSTERAARSLLEQWNYQMGQDSAAGSVWWTYLNDYVSAVFRPWWTAKRVPVRLDPSGLDLSGLPASLLEDLQQWTLHDQGNPAFTPPGGPARNATAAMRTAFAEAVRSLSAKLGPDPAAWYWGRLHSQAIPSITGYTALGYGPYESGGDPRTIDAADGGLMSSFGPSWRMVVDWTGPGVAQTASAYPGGQSENPASPWYENLLSLWLAGRYLPLPGNGGGHVGQVSWTLRPGV